jgi:MFS transporter, DHA3 family, macrolide efflux protein
MSQSADRGFRSFVTIWIGQIVSMFGSGLTQFALGVWVYQKTGSVTLFTLIAVFATLPAISLSPFAGALVDRFDRRWLMILSDAGAAAATAALVLLLWADRLELWHLYVIVALISTANAVQFPAFGASITLLVPKQHFGRVGGMMQFGTSAAEILAPLLAGVLIGTLHIHGVIAIDLATFLFAAVMLLLIRIPRPEVSAAGAAGRGSLLRQAGFGWTYIRQRPGLLALLAYFSGINFLFPFGLVLATPLVLSFAGTEELGMVLAIGAAGSVVGSLVMSAWGGPKRKIHGILGLGPVLALGLVLAGLRPSVPLVAAGLFLAFSAIPILNASSQAIWQVKVEPDVQGRVFAMRRMIAQITAPLAFFLAGPLAENVFNPLLEPGGALAGSVGAVLGTGEGRGIGLLLVIMGLAFLALTAIGYSYRRLRLLEDDLPDAVPARPSAIPASA